MMLFEERRDRKGYGKQHCEIIGMLGMGALGIGGGVLGGLFGSKAEKQKNALMQQQLNQARSIDSRTYGDLAPYRAFGNENMNNFRQTMAEDPMSYMDPGYQFRLKAGSDAVMNNAASAGMLGSGDTLRALTNFGQDMGSQEYNNAFNRQMGKAGMYQGNIGVGLNAATQGGALGNQMAATSGQIASQMDPGGSNRIWGNYLGGLGGMAMGAAGTMGAGGGSNIFSGLGNLFKKPAAGPAHDSNWLGAYGRR